MIIKKEYKGKRLLDLTGPDGNCFVLLGIAKKLCEEQKRDSQVVLDEMRSSDYEHLVETFDKEFGDQFILVR